MNTCKAFRRTLRMRLFPSRAWPPIEPQNPNVWAEGAITICTKVHAGWVDRLRFLISGKAEVVSRLYTSDLVLRCKASSPVFYVLPPNAEVPREEERRDL